jgi:hypothetical protein
MYRHAVGRAWWWVRIPSLDLRSRKVVTWISLRGNRSHPYSSAAGEQLSRVPLP